MFQEKERLVFSYEVRGEKRYADPLALRRALLRESGGQFFSWWATAKEPDEVPVPPEPSADPKAPPTPAMLGYAFLVAQWMSAMDADEKCVKCIRAAFKLPDFDEKTGDGITDKECWNILGKHSEWLEGNVRDAAASPTTSAAASPPGPAGS